MPSRRWSTPDHKSDGLHYEKSTGHGAGNGGKSRPEGGKGGQSLKRWRERLRRAHDGNDQTHASQR
eukprot:5405286-Heterocapsa_arctica.AAC.1